MAAYNHVVLVGNITRDIEVKYTQSGTAVCDLGLAVSEKYKDSNGEWQDAVSFIDCTCWAKTAELASEYLSKGSPVLVDGRLKQDRWQDKETGGNRSKLRVIVQRLQFLGKKGDGTQTERRYDESESQYSRQVDESDGASQDNDSPASTEYAGDKEEIPF